MLLGQDLFEHALSLVVPHLSLAALVSAPPAAARDLGGASGKLDKLTVELSVRSNM